jgi:hypothetical protein
MHFIFLLLYLGFVCGVVFFTLTALLRRLTTWYRIWHTLPRPIAQTSSLQEAAFSGTIQPMAGLLTSPLTGTPCVWWRLNIREDRGRNAWSMLGQRTSSAPFLVQDTTSTLMIEPNKSMPYPGDPMLWNGPDLSETLRDLSFDGMLDKKWFNPRRVWLREWYLTPNEVVYVQGWFVDMLPHPRLSALATTPLIISDCSRSALLSDLGVQLAGLSLLLVSSIIVPGLMLWQFWVAGT